MHRVNIFPKVAFFRELLVIFVSFVGLQTDIDMKYLLKIFVFSAVLGLSQLAWAQNQGQKRMTDAILLNGVELYNKGEIEKAARIFRSITDSYPDYDAAHYYLALTCLQQQEIDLAESELLKACAADPSNFWYRHRLAAVYQYTGQLSKAIDMYTGLLADFPKKSDLYYDLVELYVAVEDIDKALATLDEIENVFGATEATAIYRFRLLMASKRTADGYKSLETFNSKYSSPLILTTLGDYRMSMFEDSLAVSYYDEALSIDKDFAPAILGKAEALRMTRRYDEFFPLLDAYVENDGVPAASKSEYLSALTQQTDAKFVSSFSERLDTAMNICFRKHPADSAVIATAAGYYYRTGREDVAGGLFKLNADIHPDKPELLATYLYSLMYSAKWKELAEEGKIAAMKYPEITDFMMLSGVGYNYLEDYPEVIKLSEEILKKAPNDTSVAVSAYSAMGDAYYRMNRSKDAFKAYDKVLKYDPDNIYVLNNYAYYLSVQGKNLKKAYTMSKKTIEAEPDNATYLDTFGWILYLQGKALEAKPFFKHAMLYGGKDSVVIMDHYAEVLFTLKEYDLAFLYWYKAQEKNDGQIPDLNERVAQRKKSIGR